MTDDDAYLAALAEDRLRTICKLRGLDPNPIVKLSEEIAQARALTIPEALEQYELLVRQRRI